LGVITQTALGAPVSFSSTCTWPFVGHRDEHRSQIQPPDRRGFRVVEVLEVEWALERPRRR
jgi:hypothetical protein